MSSSSSSPDTAGVPRASDARAAQLGRERWLEAAARGDPASAAAVERIIHGNEARALLDGAFGNSPFLARSAARHPADLRRFFESGPDPSMEAILADLSAAAGSARNAGALDKALRQARARAALVVAFADIAGRWPLDRVVGALSMLAERCVGHAADWHLRAAAEAGDLELPDLSAPGRGSGYVVLGMGKLGARELNYSSDIDLIVLFDDEIARCPDPDRLQRTFIRLTRALVRSLDEPTGDGYVFRVDLRLRPDPGSTPLAVSMRGAETYYESTGQNWERAAMIKARPVAGDVDSGNVFLEYLRPYVWRKHLDFAAIEDIHSIKRQIHAARGGGDIKVRGHNIKLGRGGIREIEFFAQTQQLIWGGRDPSVRAAATCDALRALAAAGHIGEDTLDDLVAAYRFLRRVEHRLQMVDDQQTHVLPTEPGELEKIAGFLGYDGLEAFTAELLGHMRTVERHYAHLFEKAPSLSGPGNLVFTGAEDDPETLHTLERLGYDDPRSVAAVVRGWHHGRYRAMRSTRARELLTELKPHLLAAFARTASPKAALVRFDEFMRRLPAGVQIFSLFHANPSLIDLLAEVLGSAPRLAESLSRNAGLFDAVLTQGFFDELPDRDTLRRELDIALGQARDFQDVLDVLRRWTRDHQFQVGVQMLRGRTDGHRAGAPLSDLADIAISTLQARVEEEFAAQHGRFADNGMAIVAMGKLGGREMTVTSDLDLIFIYDIGDADASDGPRPLPPSQYYARLSQRFLNAVTAQTAEGALYAVDMRLRPSGNKGPIASSLQGFVDYHRSAAWTWEHLALTRARVISGPPALTARVEAAIGEVLLRRRDADALRRDVADMRARIEREKGSASIWEVKSFRGGLIDAEFLAQYWQLLHAHDHPEVLSTNTAEAFRRLAEVGCVGHEEATRLASAVALWHKVQGFLRFTLDRNFDPETAPAALKEAMARACGVERFGDLEPALHDAAAAIHERFLAEIGEPEDGAQAAEAGNRKS